MCLLWFVWASFFISKKIRGFDLRVSYKEITSNGALCCFKNFKTVPYIDKGNDRKMFTVVCLKFTKDTTGMVKSMLDVKIDKPISLIFRKKNLWLRLLKKFVSKEAFFCNILMKILSENWMLSISFSNKLSKSSSWLFSW